MFPMQVVITVNSREELDALLGPKMVDLNSGPSYDELVAALMKLPHRTARELLASFKVSAPYGLDKRQYAAVIQAAKDLT